MLNFLDHKEMIPNNKNSVYDLKVIAGDQEYVKSMSQEILSSIPEEFSLGQNYPNPFNPITQMEYSLPQSSKVVISIYNVLGQEIKTLVNKEQDYGYHSVRWDGTDRLGKSVASGVYFTQMRSSGFSESKKMLLLKFFDEMIIKSFYCLYSVCSNSISIELNHFLTRRVEKNFSKNFVVMKSFFVSFWSTVRGSRWLPPFRALIERSVEISTERSGNFLANFV